MFLRRAINQSCWLELTWSMYRRAVRQAAKFRNKKIEIALSSATWSVTWHSIFGEGDVCWGPDQWKERTVTPGYVVVRNSSVTVGLDSVFKSYIKRRLEWIVMRRTLWAVFLRTYACSYILTIWNVKIYSYSELILSFLTDPLPPKSTKTSPSQDYPFKLTTNYKRIVCRSNVTPVSRRCRIVCRDFQQLRRRRK